MKQGQYKLVQGLIIKNILLVNWLKNKTQMEEQKMKKTIICTLITFIVISFSNICLAGDFPEGYPSPERYPSPEIYPSDGDVAQILSSIEFLRCFNKLPIRHQDMLTEITNYHQTILRSFGLDPVKLANISKEKLEEINSILFKTIA